MPALRQILATLLAAMALMLAVPAAQAQVVYGTPAWSTGDLVLHEGPGGAYRVVGHIPDDTRLRVYRCSPLWCVVGDGHQKGWTRSGAISFGVSSADWFSGPRLEYPTGGTFCLYEGNNYTGQSYCFNSGTNISDLLLMGLDNRFSSIKVNGGSASLCRDRKFQSYCTRIIRDTPVLNSFLNDNVSSIRGHRTQ